MNFFQYLKTHKWFFLLCAGVSAVLLFSLNQSLWLDEAVTARVVRQYSLVAIMREFSPHDFHPPLYYLLMKIWTAFFGYSEVLLRLPSVIFALLTAWLVYRLVALRSSWWGAAFFLVNPLIIYYAQEARMYMMAVFLLTAGWYFIEKNLKKPKVNFAIWAGIFFSLAFAVFYGSAFFIAAVIVNLLFRKRYNELLVICFMLLVSFLLLFPLLLRQFAASRIALAQVVNWKNVLGASSLKNALLIPLKFTMGRISFYPKWLYWFAAGVSTMIVWFFVFLGGMRKKQHLFLLFFPLVAGFIVSFFSPLLQYFRFLYLIPVMSVLIVYGTEKHKSARAIILVFFVIYSFLYILLPTFHREDWKSLTASLPYKSSIYMIPSSADPIYYYRPDIAVRPLSTAAEAVEKTIIIVPYTANIHGVFYQQELKQRGYVLHKEVSYREIILEKWQRVL